MKNINNRLIVLRKQHNFTQADIAEYLGVSQTLITKVESNERNLKLTKLLKLCDLYNVSEEYLLCGEGDGVEGPFFIKDNKAINPKTIARMNKIMINLKRMIDLDSEYELKNKELKKKEG